MLNEFEVPRFHIFPIIGKPHSSIFSINFGCKKLEKVKRLLSFAVVHPIECSDSIVPIVTTEYEAQKQKTGMLLC